MSTKLSCLLLDDELPSLTYLKLLCEQIPQLEVIKAFNDPFVFLKEVPNLDFDLCILDIEMPGMNGLEVAKQLNTKQLIFTTAYKEYAAEAYDLEAIDYIRKPIQKERLEKAVSKAAERLGANPQKAFIQLNTNKGKTLLFFNDILLITTAEIDKRDKLVYMESGQQLILKNTSFDYLLNVLPTAHFCRVSKKEVIALKAVKFFIHDEVTTHLTDVNGANLKINLSEIYRTHFLDKIQK